MVGWVIIMSVHHSHSTFSVPGKHHRISSSCCYIAGIDIPFLTNEEAEIGLCVM